MRYTGELAEYLASKLGTSIPAGTSLELWSLPILLKVVERIEDLETKVMLLEKAVKDQGMRK